MIAFDRIGAGKPVVFLHSGLADRTMWEPQVEAFSQHFTCYFVDLPGYGESGDPPGPFSYPQEIARFIETTVGQPAALIGSSFGAGIALDTALMAPASSGPLVLVDGLLVQDGEPSAVVQAIWSEADEAWDAGSKDRAVEVETIGWVDGRGRPDRTAAEDVRAYFARVNRTIWERHDRHPLPETLPGPERDLASVQQPVLLIDGPYDVPDVLTSNQTAVARFPNATYASIPGSAHFPSREQPGEFNQLVVDFLLKHWGDRDTSPGYSLGDRYDP
ncbi:MAG: alpha/beta hydrolase [Thermomicrobiales bacterium]|nr:alpha/beta hydrolase [Thermomicrobiales bacterium]